METYISRGRLARSGVFTMSTEAKLKKNLTLFDVYAVSTGAMFSSGFFLLPGIAASYTGDSVYLAYLLAGFLIIPAMLCMACMPPVSLRGAAPLTQSCRALPIFSTARAPRK